jgi:hypothetical protein
MKIEVSIGEIVDKLSILELKLEHIKDKDKLQNINKEYSYLKTVVFSDLCISIDDYNILLNVNRELWEIEDKIRVKELNKQFDNEFIKLARSVYQVNDIRADLKKEINIKYNSSLVEEKSYQKY